MKFVLFRHAHKGILPFEDPELSPRGFEQANHISDLIQKNNIITPTHLYVSPKKRTLQTFYPTSKALNLKINTDYDLDQQSSNESRHHLKKRAQDFLTKIEDLQKPEFVAFACTHYDWIEEAMSLINCDKELNSFEFTHWSPAQYIEFEIQDNLWKFIRKGVAQ